MSTEEKVMEPRMFSIKGDHGGSSRGRGAFQMERGGFGRGRGVYGAGRGGFGRGRGVYGAGRGGFGRGRGRGGGYENNENILSRIFNTPLYQLSRRLKGICLEEFDGRSFGELFSFLYTVSLWTYEGNLDHWNEVRELGNKFVNKKEEKQRLWMKLIGSLPPPTLKQSLSTCKEYICNDLGLWCLENPDPDWPQLEFLSPAVVLEKEVTSAVGECRLSPSLLLQRLSPCGKAFLMNKYREERRKQILSAAEFFKKKPESFPWEQRTVYKVPDIVIKVE